MKFSFSVIVLLFVTLFSRCEVGPCFLLHHCGEDFRWSSSVENTPPIFQRLFQCKAPAVDYSHVVCKRFHLEQWDNFFSRYSSNSPLVWSSQDRVALFGQFQLYRYQNYRRFLRQFDEFEDRIVQIDEIQRNNLLAKRQLEKTPINGSLHYRNLSEYISGEAKHARDYLAQQEKARQLQKQQKHKAKLLQEDRLFITERFSSQWQDFEECALSFMEDADDFEDESTGLYVTHLRDRANAIHSATENNYAVCTKHYQISQSTQIFFAYAGIDSFLFRNCTGNAIQQQLHAELLSVAQECVKAHTLLLMHQKARPDFSLLGDCIGIAREANQAGHVGFGYKLADFCWSFCDCIKAVGQGAIDGVEHIAQMIVHPIETTKNIAVSTVELCKAVGRAAWYLSDLLVHTGALETMERFAPGQNQDALEELTEKLSVIDQNITLAVERLRKMPMREILRGGTRIATEAFLFGRTLRVVGKIFKRSKSAAVALVERCKKGERVAALGAGGIELPVASKTVRQLESELERGGGWIKRKSRQPKRTVDQLPFKPGKPKIPFAVAKEQYKKAFEELGYKFFSKKKYKHVFNGHYEDGSDYLYNLLKKGKKVSSFSVNENFVEIALETIKRGKDLKKCGKAYNFGRIIGKDEFGNPTSFAKVVSLEMENGVNSVYPVAESKLVWA